MDKKLQRKIAREGDRRPFASSGLRCLVRRNREMGNLCGYVGVPKGSVLYGVDYDQPLCGHKSHMNHTLVSMVPAHGGLTWAGKFRKDGPWYFGFDCAHYYDFVPYADSLLPLARNTNAVYRDMKYVSSVCRELAGAIAEVEKLAEARVIELIL